MKRLASLVLILGLCTAPAVASAQDYDYRDFQARGEGIPVIETPVGSAAALQPATVVSPEPRTIGEITLVDFQQRGEGHIS